MSLIRVEVEKLREKADELEASARRLRELAVQAYNVAEAAPSYDGQFGPKVRGMGNEARADITAKAEQVEALSVDLRERADAFEEADREFHAAPAGMQRRGDYPLSQIQWGDPNQEAPWWLIELIVGMFPFGDSIDIMKQVFAWILEGEADELILILAIIGLAMDFGWLDGLIPDPVDAANAGIALLKGLVRQIPVGPARDAIKATLVRLARNADEAPEFFAALNQIIKREEVLDALKANPRALSALLDAGPEAMELLARNEEVALELLKHGDDAAPFLKNADALEVLVRHGPEGIEKLVQYGDEGAELIATHKGEMVGFLVRTPDDTGTLAVRTGASLEAGAELRRVGLDSPQSSELIETIARNSTHGAGDRIVLGEWVDPEDWAEMGGGYVGDALSNGGIYYDTPPGLYPVLRDAGDAAWQTNGRFLRNQMEAGVGRIEYLGDVRRELDFGDPRTSRWKELNLLMEEAGDMGYEFIQDANTWALSP